MSDDAVIAVTTEGERTILAPEGDVDMSRSPALRGAIREAFSGGARTLAIDLGGVGYMDSSGLATLVEAMKLAKSSSAELVLCAMNDRVRAIFEIAKLDQYFTIVADRSAIGGS
ncbi:MAG: STAS domain-containing protein [Planctomycetota bacterium]